MKGLTFCLLNFRVSKQPEHVSSREALQGLMNFTDERRSKSPGNRRGSIFNLLPISRTSSMEEFSDSEYSKINNNKVICYLVNDHQQLLKACLLNVMFVLFTLFNFSNILFMVLLSPQAEIHTELIAAQAHLMMAVLYILKEKDVNSIQKRICSHIKNCTQTFK